MSEYAHNIPGTVGPAGMAHDMAKSMAMPATGPSEIADAQMQLTNIVGEITERLENLADMLEPVLRPPSPEAVHEPSNIHPTTGVALADIINADVARLRVTRDRLINLRQRAAL